MHKLKIELTKFTLVGAANFILTFIVFYGLLEVARSGYILALFIAWSVGVIFTYVFNYIWVFKPEKRFVFRRRFFKYLISNSLSLAVNVILLAFFVEFGKFDAFYSQVFLIPVVVALNFLSAKYWSLRANCTSFEQKRS